MSAVVLDFQQAVRRRNGVVAQRKAGMGVDDAITQAVMEHFKNYPISIVAVAIQSARISLAGGGGFIQAMDAAAQTIATLAPSVDRDVTIDARNHGRIDQLARRRERRTAAMHDICERMIRAYLKDQLEAEIAMAIQRARRVLSGGGSLCTAVYHATNVDFNT